MRSSSQEVAKPEKIDAQVRLTPPCDLLPMLNKRKFLLVRMKPRHVCERHLDGVLGADSQVTHGIYRLLCFRVYLGNKALVRRLVESWEGRNILGMLEILGVSP